MTTQTDQIQTIPDGKVEGSRLVIRLTIWDILRALTRWRRNPPLGLALSGDDGNTSAHPPRYGRFDVPEPVNAKRDLPPPGPPDYF